MPTYDYQCESCGYEFEAFHAMSAESLLECPECHEHKLIKLISPGVTVIVRGTENPCRETQGSKTKKKLDKLGKGKNKGKKPFWRDGPVNKDILKNPKQYIEKGKVE